MPSQNKWTLFDLQSFYQHPLHCNNFSSGLMAMIECWNFLNSKLWGLVRCRKKRISALEIGIWDEPWKFPMHLCSAIFTPSNLSYLSALTRRCRLFTSTRERVKKEWRKLQNLHFDLQILPSIIDGTYAYLLLLITFFTYLERCSNFEFGAIHKFCVSSSKGQLVL